MSCRVAFFAVWNDFRVNLTLRSKRPKTVVLPTAPLRSLSRTSEDLRQARRLLSLACVYDGMNRADAAKGDGMAWQSLRDRGVGFVQDIDLDGFFKVAAE